MARLFGFEIKRTSAEEEQSNDIPSFAPRETDDGALVVNAGGTFGTYLDLEGSAKTEAEIVAKYREMAIQPECDAAIANIVDEAICKTDNENIVSLDLENLELTDPIKDKIHEAFDKIDSLLDFNNSGYDIFRRWYVDGRLYYHIMIDTSNPKAGIQELRYIDPRKIRKVRSVKRVRKGTVFTNIVDNEFFMYSERGFKGASATGMDNQGLQIAKDSIIHVPSGVVDRDNKIVLGYLHKAIKPLNQLRILEDATVIYRISRAPERRIFSIDVGNLPKMKAEQHVRDIMTKHKNRLIYDASTGDVRDDRKFMTMLEDYWFPRRTGGGGTQVTTLPSGQNLGELADVQYFEKKLYKSLNVPVSRLESETGFSLGRASEITRDELHFQKFIYRLRTKFSNLLYKALEKQLVLTGVIAAEEWEDLKKHINFKFSVDSYFAELKNEEIIRERMNTLATVDPFVGKYYSQDWVKRNVLQFSDEDIEKMDEQIQEEQQKDMQNQQLMQQNQPDDQGGDEQDQTQQGGSGFASNEPQLASDNMGGS